MAMVEEMKRHYAQIRKILIWILILNWAVALAKIIYGLISRCSSMTADGFHSLSDGASNILGLIGIGFASQPKDQDHPYGHRKYETLFAMGIGVIMILLSFNLIKEGLGRFVKPITPSVDLISFVVMVVTIFINIWVMVYESRMGKRLQSDILVSDAMHTRADILTSLSVIFALLAIRFGIIIFDPIITLAIALFIGYSAWEIFRDSSRVLCDYAAFIDEKRISDIVLGIKGVKTCHKIRTRGRLDEVYLDLHVQVDPKMAIADAHKISYAIEDAIKKKIPNITDIVVHIEPQEK